MDYDDDDDDNGAMMMRYIVVVVVLFITQFHSRFLYPYLVCCIWQVCMEHLLCNKFFESFYQAGRFLRGVNNIDFVEAGIIVFQKTLYSALVFYGSVELKQKIEFFFQNVP